MALGSEMGPPARQLWEEWSTIGRGWRRRPRLFPLSGSTGAGNEVLMLLMGKAKQSDQSMSTIAEQQRAWGSVAR